MYTRMLTAFAAKEEDGGATKEELSIIGMVYGKEGFKNFVT